MRATQHQSGIYRLAIGETFYIGSAKWLRKREREHLRELERGIHSNDRLQKCWNKHQEVKWDVLEFCNEVKLLEREQHYIDAFIFDERCANVLPTAGSCLGRQHTDETKRKISEGNKGQRRTPEQIARMSAAQAAVNSLAEVRHRKSAAQVGKQLPKEVRERISFALSGREFSQEHRERLSQAGRGRIVSTQTRKKISEATKGRKNSPAAVERTRQANLGSKRSEQTKEKMRLAWERRRQANSGKYGSQASGTETDSGTSLI